MHSFGRGVFKRPALAVRNQRGTLRAAAAVMLTLISGVPSGFAQQTTANPPKEKASSALPSAPAPVATEPFSLRQTERDFSRPTGDILGDPQIGRASCRERV